MIDIRVPVNITATPPKIRKVRRKARHSHNDMGSLHLIPLPFGLGLNYGKGFGIASPSLRSWEWARYDFADHEPYGSTRWIALQLEGEPEASHPIAAAWEAWRANR
jgi:hypothetical protein